jgi:histidine triad (HIT) family protein
MSDDCLFCRIVAGEIPAPRVYEDDRVIVIPDKFPKADVHLLAIPREHIPSLYELEPSHTDLVGHIMRLLPRLATEQGLKGFRTVINTGKAGGQEIFHLHVHLLGGKLGGL